MMRVDVDDHEIFVAAILGLLLRVRQQAAGIEFSALGSRTIGVIMFMGFSLALLEARSRGACR